MSDLPAGNDAAPVVEPRRKKRLYPRSYGKPQHAIRIPATAVKTDEAKGEATAVSPLTGEERTRDIIRLPNGIVAVRIWSRNYVFVDEPDVATVVGYDWKVRALNRYNACYRGVQTFWEEPGRFGPRPVRFRMFLHDLLMETPQRTGPALFEWAGPYWIVQHLDYNGMNCTTANMRLIQSPDGYVPEPPVNLPVGVWWNYRRHRWSVRCMPEGAWYVELGTFETFEEAAIAYFDCLAQWPERRHESEVQYAWGEMIEYKGRHYAISEWAALRAAERREQEQP